mmetsp:Transcript_4674/g.12035  ORF Transcript_4674/g.12035 Transcript_4674/m.12035 type:complete len:210 (-) Transcript_4674:63-692(-)
MGFEDGRGGGGCILSSSSSSASSASSSILPAGSCDSGPSAGSWCTRRSSSAAGMSSRLSSGFSSALPTHHTSEKTTMLPKMSSHRMSLVPTLSIMYLVLGKTSVPKNLSRPSGKSMYITGFCVSRCLSVPSLPPALGVMDTLKSSMYLFFRMEVFFTMSFPLARCSSLEGGFGSGHIRLVLESTPPFCAASFSRALSSRAARASGVSSA